MLDHRYTFLRGLTFFFFSTLIASILILLTVHLAAASTSSVNDTWSTSSSMSVSDPLSTTNDPFTTAVESMGTAAAQTAHDINFGIVTRGTRAVGHGLHQSASSVGHGVGDGVSAIVHTPGHAVRFVASITNVKTFIEPAAKAHAPAITPVATAVVIQLPAPPAQPIISTIAPTVDTSIPLYQANDLYTWGNCTWWVSILRARLNDPIPNNWGNAATWAERAAADGYVVDHNPTPGSIMQTPNSAGGLGHVALVQSVDSNGTWHISEMNFIGLDKIDTRTEPASMAANYSFIHDTN